MVVVRQLTEAEVAALATLQEIAGLALCAKDGATPPKTILSRIGAMSTRALIDLSASPEEPPRE